MSTNIKLKRSSVKGKAPVTSNLELGEIAINTNDGRLFFKTVDSASNASIVEVREMTAGTGLTKTGGELKITDTGVTAGTYGSASQVPVFTVNAQGQIDSAGYQTVAGVSSFAYDSDTHKLTIQTADGGVFETVIDLSAFNTDEISEGSTNLYYTSARANADFDTRLATKSTTDLAEGSNLYYTTARFDSDFGDNTTDDLPQGQTNLYYDSDRTTTTARYAISATGSISYNAATGVISYVEQPYTGFDSDFTEKNTDDLSEGSSNLYFTTQRVRDSLSVGGSGALSYDSATGRITYNEIQYQGFDSDFDIAFTGKTTADLTELTNLYFTTQRARDTISVTDAGGDGSLSYNAGNGVITYTGPSASETRAHFSGGTGVTITNGVIAIGQPVDSSANVTFNDITAGKIDVDSAQVGCLHLDKQATAPNSQAGLLYYDSDPQKGLSFIPTTNELVQDVTINIGQEVLVYVHNLTGAQINNGQAVYISDVAHGAHPQVTLAKADNASTARPLGLATQDIPDGAHGYVTKLGLVRDVNTLGMTPGGLAYLSKDSDGQWSTTEVSVDSGYPTHIGTVLTVDSAQGTIFVDVEPEHFEYLRVQDKIVTHDLEAPDIYSSHIHLDGKDPGYYAEGLVYYDSGNGALVVKNDEQEITLQVGQEEWIRVYNNSGSTITNGTPVYLSGTSNGLPSIVASDAVNSNGVNGLATHDIENGSVGYVTARGVVNDINTQGISVGSKIHVGVGGGLTGNTIDYPNYPNDVGVCLLEDSVAGRIYVDIVDHTMETLRVTEDARFDQDVTIGGNLNVIGVTTEVLSQSLTTSGNLLQLLDGDTVGTAYQNVGGLNDATFKGKYTGDSDVYYFVRMFSVDSAAVGDVIEWGISDSDTIHPSNYGIGFDSVGGQTTWNLKDDGLSAPLRNGLSIQFINLSGHDSADLWCAHPTELNLDLGMIGNYNQQDAPLKYAGVVRDATDERWKFFDDYPAASIDSSSAQFDINFDSASLADIEFNNAYGNLSGNATTATTATQLANSRNFLLTGDITSNSVGFNGTGNVSLTTSIANNSITNSMINASAAIVDTKLATISTSGKVQNSATTATASNNGSTIVARDASGNFSAGTITANLTGTASNASQLNSQDPSYYLDYGNFTNAPNMFKKINIQNLDTFEPDSANDVFNIRAGTGITLSVDSANDAVIIDTKATTPLVTDLFTATQGQTAFPLTSTPIAEQDLIVFVEGVYQNSRSYVLAGTTITMDEALDSGMEVVVHAVGSNLVSGDVQFGQAVSGTRVGYTTNTSETTIATFDKTKYRTMHLQVQVTDTVSSEYEMSQMNLVHDGTTATTTEYGIIFTGDSDLGDMDANIVGNNLNVTFTSANSNAKTIKLHFNAIKV